MKINKKILAISWASTAGVIALSTGLGVGLTQTSNTITSTNQNKTNETRSLFNVDFDRDVQWDNFLKKESVVAVLETIYEDPVQREAYIQQQRSIDDISYLNEIKRWNNYYNQADNIHEGSAIIGWKNAEGAPYPLRRGQNDFESLISYNWLWYLFNMDRFIYLLIPESDSPSNERKKGEQILGAHSENKQFYRPNTNTITDYVKVNVKNGFDDSDPNENQKEIHFFILNSDGFWTEITVWKTYDKTTKELTNTEVKGNIFLYTLPNLYNIRDQLKERFNFPKYINAFVSTARGYTSYSSFYATLLEEEYGGSVLRYAINDNDVKK